MTKTARTFALLKRGWITAFECAQRGGSFALSQRAGEFRRAGHQIDAKWVRTPGGARVLAYRLIKEA